MKILMIKQVSAKRGDIPTGIVAAPTPGIGRGLLAKHLDNPDINNPGIYSVTNLGNLTVPQVISTGDGTCMIHS